HESALEADAIEHLVDLRAAAMDHDRVHADLLHQDDVTCHQVAELGVGHGVAAIFDHEGGVVVPAHKGQRLGDSLRHADEPPLLLIRLDSVVLDSVVRHVLRALRLAKALYPGRERAKAAFYIRRAADRRSGATPSRICSMFDSDTLAQRGFAVAPALIGPEECQALASLWPDKSRFRSHLIMQRHGYGQ